MKSVKTHVRKRSKMEQNQECEGKITAPQGVSKMMMCWKVLRRMTTENRQDAGERKAAGRPKHAKESTNGVLAAGGPAAVLLWY